MISFRWTLVAAGTIFVGGLSVGAAERHDGSRLGSPTFALREEATDALVDRGEAAIDVATATIERGGAEASWRAFYVLERLVETSDARARERVGDVLNRLATSPDPIVARRAKALVAQIEGGRLMAGIQGTWKVEAGEIQGQNDGSLDGITFKFEGRKFVLAQSGSDVMKGELRLAATKPAQIDFLAEQPMHGIYKIEDGRLVMCIVEAGSPRPVAFTSHGAQFQVLITLKKVEGRGSKVKGQ